MLIAVALSLKVLAVGAMQATPSGEERSIQLREVTSEWHWQASYENGARGQKYMPETMGSGMAVLDYDGD